MLHRLYLYINTEASKDCCVYIFRVKHSNNRLCFLCRILEKSKCWLLQKLSNTVQPVLISALCLEILFSSYHATVTKIRFHFFSIENLSTKWPNLELNPIVHVVSSLGSLPPVRKGQVGQWH